MKRRFAPSTAAEWWYSPRIPFTAWEPLRERTAFSRSAGVVNTGRAAGEDNALGVDVPDRLPGAGSGKDLGIYFEFSDAAGDQVAVLRAEVDNDYALVDRLGFILRF